MRAGIMIKVMQKGHKAKNGKGKVICQVCRKTQLISKDPKVGKGSLRINLRTQGKCTVSQSFPQDQPIRCYRLYSQINSEVLKI